MAAAHVTKIERYYGLLLGALAFILYLVLRQDSGYGDGPRALLDVRAGETFRHSLHFLYMPMVAGLRALLPPVFSLFQVAGILSALGTALGVVFLYEATRVLLASTKDVFLVAGLCALCPAVVFYATVVEFHGPFFAFSSLATLAMTWMVRSPRPGCAVVLGVTTGLAYFAHASGHLLPLLLSGCFLALSTERQPRDRRPWPRWLALCGLAGLVHVLLTVGGSLLVSAFGTYVSSSSAFEWLLEEGGRQGGQLHLLLATIWYEGAWSYLPISVTWLLAWGTRSRRPTALALALAALPYLVISCLLVPGYNEHGAYLLPLAWVAALLTVRCLDPRLCVALLATSLVVAVVQVWLQDDPGRCQAYAEGVREIAGGRKVSLIVGRQEDYEACVISLPSTPFVDIAKSGMQDPEALRRMLPAMDAILRESLAGGTVMLLSEGGYRQITSPVSAQRFPGAVLLRQHLEDNYLLEPVKARGFTGWRIQGRE